MTDPADPDRCSAKGCTRPADWRLLWNNPRLHTPERRKTWLACEDHRESLAAFLTARSFLKEVKPHPAADPSAAPAEDSAGNSAEDSAADR